MTSQAAFATQTNIHKLSSQSGFTRVANWILEKLSLSPLALKVHIFLQSKSEKWKIHVSHIARSLKICRDTVYRKLAELKAVGLIHSEFKRDENGRFSHRYQSYAEPFAVSSGHIPPVRSKPQTIKRKTSKRKDHCEPETPAGGNDLLQADQGLETPTPELPTVIDHTVPPVAVIESPAEPIESPVLPDLPADDTEVGEPEVIKPEPPKEKFPSSKEAFYSCLEKLSHFPDRVKRSLMKYSEKIVEDVVKYTHNPKANITGGPIALIKATQHAAKHYESYKKSIKLIDDPNKSSKSRYEILINFTNGKLYNGYEFVIDKQGAGFIHPNGCVTYSYYFKDGGFEKKFINLLKNKNIPISPD